MKLAQSDRAKATGQVVIKLEQQKIRPRASFVPRKEFPNNPKGTRQKPDSAWLMGV